LPIAIRIFLAFVGLFVFQGSQADKELSLINVKGNYPPYEMRNRAGQLSGFYVELIAAVSKDLGYKPRYTTLPWRRGLQAMLNGKADAMLSVNSTPEREDFLWLLPGNVLGVLVDVFCVLKQHPLAKNYNGKLEQLRPYTLGLVNGYEYAKEIEQSPFLKRQYIAKDDEQLLKLLLRGRVDVIMVEPEVTLYKARQHGVLDQLACLSPGYDVGPEYIAFSKSRKRYQLALEFSQALGRFKMTADYQALEDKYNIGSADFFAQ